MYGSVCWVLRPTNFLEQCLCGRWAYLIFLDVESFTTAITMMCVPPSQGRLSRFICAVERRRPRRPDRCESGAREAAIASMLACCKLRYNSALDKSTDSVRFQITLIYMDIDARGHTC